MILRRIKIACLLSAMMMGVMATTLPAMTVVANKVEATENEWTLLETKEGVSCYYINGPLGTCNNAVLLKVVNNSASAVTVDFTIEIDRVAVSKKITVDAGQTIDAYSDPSLSIRPVPLLSLLFHLQFLNN
jgi:hypothetical protein